MCGKSISLEKVISILVVLSSLILLDATATFASDQWEQSLCSGFQAISKAFSGNWGLDVWSLDRSKIAVVTYLSTGEHNGYTNKEIFVLNVQSNAAPVNASAHLAPDENPAWSPDGRRIAFSSARNSTNEIFVMDSDGRNLVNLTHADKHSSMDNAYNPAWSPDGSRIAFESTVEGSHIAIFIMKADGQDVKNLSKAAGRNWTDMAPTWSPNSDRIAFLSQSGPNGFGLWVVNTDGSGLHCLVKEGLRRPRPLWSPDGKRMVFIYSIDGQDFPQIFSINVDGGRVKQLTKESNGANPRFWSPDGKKIAYLAGDESYWVLYTVDADGNNRTSLCSVKR